MSDLYKHIQLQISNAAAGQTIWVELQAESVPIAWSTGQPYEGSGGISISVPAGGALPLTSFNINTAQVQVQTTAASGGSGGALIFNVALYLVAGQGIQTFALRSRSDPGVQVLVSVGDQQPQVVNQTYTYFPWNPQ